jgi:hypothetical protein
LLACDGLAVDAEATLGVVSEGEEEAIAIGDEAGGGEQDGVRKARARGDEVGVGVGDVFEDLVAESVEFERGVLVADFESDFEVEREGGEIGVARF